MVKPSRLPLSISWATRDEGFLNHDSYFIGVVQEEHDVESILKPATPEDSERAVDNRSTS